LPFIEIGGLNVAAETLNPEGDFAIAAAISPGDRLETPLICIEAPLILL
jgi:hypothetical protein